MSKKFIKKNIELSLELDRYLYKNPRAFNSIPRGACLIITQKGNQAFNKTSWNIAEKAKEEHQKCIEARKEGKKWTFQPLPV